MLTTHSLLLFLTFFPRATPHHPLSSTAPTHRLALSITLVCLLHLFLTILVSAVVLYFAPAHLSTLAAILGILATILAAIQYLPQIYTTWRLQKVGSLSIPMMCIQTPGSFVWVASLASRLGWAGWRSGRGEEGRAMMVRRGPMDMQTVLAMTASKSMKGLGFWPLNGRNNQINSTTHQSGREHASVCMGNGH